jgi:hypothetical protein
MYHRHQSALVRLLPVFCFALAPPIIFRISKVSSYQTALGKVKHFRRWSQALVPKTQTLGFVRLTWTILFVLYH